MGTSGSSEHTREEIFGLFARAAGSGTPLTAAEVADELNCTPRIATANLEELADQGKLETKTVGSDGRVWWLADSQPQTIQTNADSEFEQAQFNELVESVTDYAIFVLDADGVVQTWNEGARQLKGYEEDEIVGKHFSNFYTEAERDADIPERNLRAAKRNGRVEDEGERVRADGTRFWANVTITALYDDDGDPRGFVKVTRDMTERHEYEQRLRKEKERFETLVREVKDYAIFLLDADGVVQTWNEGAKELKGYEKDEIVGKHFSTFYTEAARDAGRPARNLRTAVEEGRVEDEGERVHEDGSTFWANVTITALHDDDGSIRGFAKVTRDMTERHEYEQQLREQRDELTELDQINAVIRDIDQALVTATTREEVEQAVCDRLAASDTYSAAWTAEYTDDYEKITPRVWAGISDDYLNSIRVADTERAKETEKGVGATALRTRTVQPVHRLHNDQNGEPWRNASLAAGYKSAITVPLMYNDVEYGVLTVYADSESAFDERKIAVLSELGETISHALAAIRRKERERTLLTLQESTRELLNTETQTEIGDIIVETLTNDLALTDALVYCFDDEANRLELVSSSIEAESVTTQLAPLTAGADSPVWTSFTEKELRTADSIVPTDDSNRRQTMAIPLGEYGVLAVTVTTQEVSDVEMRQLVTLIAATTEAAFKRTDRERRLQQQNDRLDRFASLLAHELRNPVQIGQIYSQQLPQETDSDAIRYITESFERIEELIDVMLVLTRGREAVGEQTPVVLESAALGAWDDVDAPDATLSIEVERTIRTDETYLHHLFRNLFENAVEHGSTSNRHSGDDVAEHGGDDITVTVGELPDGFYVADDGVGIPPEAREEVFEEGYTTAAERGGTGIGLAFVKELAEVYGWAYRVTESDAGGARFEFTNIHDDSRT